MESFFDNVWAQIAALAVVLAIVSGLAERRRAQRRDLDRVGFMPWPLLSVMAVLVAVVAAGLALKG